MKTNLVNLKLVSLSVVGIIGLGLWAVASCEGAATTYEPVWESFKKYKVPQWYKDAKFGIFIHWGVYSVPAYSNEWYPRSMYQEDVEEQNKWDHVEDIFQHHREKWGNHKKFGYKDFIAMFRAEKWDPEEWVKLFKKAGAKYVVPVAEHHDGFAMYDCSYTKWNAAKMGPKRDIVAELAAACRRQGLWFGVSSHRAFNWEYYTFRSDFDTMDEANWGLYGKPHPKEVPHSEQFLEDWYARCVEMVDKYKPDLFWFDFGFNHPWFEPYRKKFAAYYYNKALQWGQEVALNYKADAFPDYAAVLDIERGRLKGLRKRFWQTDTSVCHQSWGYVWDHKYKSVDYLVDELVDIVSKNGCLLLNIAPKPDGTIPAEQRRMLLDIGNWLEVNGEAIYGSRYWKIYGEGPTETVEGDMEEEEDKGFVAEDIRFTVKDDALYVICLGWPGKECRIKSLGTKAALLDKDIATVGMLGASGELEWSQGRDALAIKTPKKKPCRYAYTFKILFEK